MSEHSIFSPSASHRILSCPPSLMLCARAEEETSAYAVEGICAHELCAYLVEKALGRDVQDPTENLDYYNAEMQACAEGYAEFVMGEYAKAKAACPDAEVLVEQRVDISRWVPGCGGTADCIILSDAQVEIIDYKHGVGVPVSASSEEYGGNPQLMCYCLGVLAMFDGIYDFDTVKMVIFQPRRENVSEYTMSKADLLAWAEDTLVPTARLALEGKGEFRAGDHCRFCKVKATCRKRAEINLEAAQYDFAQPATLDPCEIDVILQMVDHLTEWANDVRDYALAQALAGTEYEHFKIVEGRSCRKYTSDTEVARVVEAAGFDPFERKLLGVTAMTSMLGKKKFEELLGPLTVKARGKPTLVPRSDKRPEMQNSAQIDFQ